MENTIIITEVRIPVRVTIDESEIYKCHNVLRFVGGDTHDIIITDVIEENDGFGPFCEVWYEYNSREFNMATIGVPEITKIIGEDVIEQYIG